MRYRTLSADGDYTFGQGAANFLVDSPAAIAQSVMTRLRLWTGEWFLDVEEGTPWTTEILGKDTRALYDRAIQTRVLETVGVESIDRYSSVFDTAARSLAVDMLITTKYGQAPVIGVLDQSQMTRAG